ncbi:MAG: ScyD/ScyE family protein [Marmoricola sp.]
MHDTPHDTSLGTPLDTSRGTPRGTSRGEPLGRRRLAALTGMLALAVPLVIPAATGLPAASARPARTVHGAPTVLADGLNNPRLLTFGPGGALYVAEAGTGGAGPCVTGGDGTSVCFGTTGSITRIRAGHQRRVVRDLPSLAGPGGAEAIGPEAVDVGGHGRYTVSMGAGIDQATRQSIGDQAHRLGTLQAGRIGGGARTVADLVAWEAANNPDHSEGRDSDPAGFVATGHGFWITDAGGNDLLRIDRNGDLHLRAVFPDRTATLPPFLGGGQAPMQAVPTAVTRGPDGALYVSQLTGFPFPEGAAQIFRVARGQAPTVWATGLTNVTDLAWRGHRLYAVEIAEHGLLSAPPGQVPAGALVHVRRGANQDLDVVARLAAPYGLAIRGHHAFVTTCSVCTGGGSVTRVPLG